MGFIEDCETSLQVLRGFDSDISSEFNEIKVQDLMNIIFTFLKYYPNIELLLFNINIAIQTEICGKLR